MPDMCLACADTGWVRVSREGIDGVVRCDCIKGSRAERLLANAKIPQRYEHCELENFDIMPSPEKSIEKAKIVAEKFVAEYPMSPPFGLLFMGPQGVGKTHLAVGIVKQLMRLKSVSCLFRTFPELLKEIQNSYNAVSQATEMGLLRPVLETEVLVLDELGAQNPSSWVRDEVAYVLTYRYNENKVTILTTNYKDEDERKDAKVGITDTLSERIGPRMRSRLFEMCKTIKMDGNDFRKAVKQAEHHF
jgi:DNA replication protein DnaC